MSWSPAVISDKLLQLQGKTPPLNEAMIHGQKEIQLTLNISIYEVLWNLQPVLATGYKAHRCPWNKKTGISALFYSYFQWIIGKVIWGFCSWILNWIPTYITVKCKTLDDALMTLPPHPTFTPHQLCIFTQRPNIGQRHQYKAGWSLFPYLTGDWVWVASRFTALGAFRAPL